VLRVEECWGTVIVVDVRDTRDEALLDDCFDWFRAVDDRFSTWRADSEIMRLARGELRVEDAHPTVREVLALSESMRIESDGAFDIAFASNPAVTPVPGRAPLDPSGIVKGWAVQKAAELLRDAGATRFFVNAGGDVFASGTSELAGSRWRVGIQHPYQRDRVAAVVEVIDCAVATSGTYERGAHIFDPGSGQPATGFASVTVVGPDLAVADAYATAVMVLGAPRGMEWLAARAWYEGFAIIDGERVVTTTGFDRYRVQ
jgi:thiamine biosynthesis lipoprotein